MDLPWAYEFAESAIYIWEAARAGRIKVGFECVIDVNCGQADQKGQMEGKDVGRKVKFKMFSVLEVFTISGGLRGKDV